MIGDLSSYIELFAAVYLTISLDDMLLKRFWTPDYKKEMEASFKKIDLPDVAKDKTYLRASSISSLEESRSRKRGVMMFSLSVLLLIIIGFEDNVKLLSTNIGYISIMVLTLLYGMVFWLDGFFLKTGWSVVRVAVFIPALYAIALCVLNKNQSIIETIDLIQQKDIWLLSSKIIVVIALLGPVLWQLFRNWLYTRFYLLYIVEQTQLRARDYNYAINYNQRRGDKMTSVSPSYQNFVADNIAQGEQDRLITPFINTLMEELEDVEFLPKVLSLLRYSFLMHRKYYPSKHRLKRLSQKYDEMKKKEDLAGYCQKNNVDYEVLREYRKK